MVVGAYCFLITKPMCIYNKTLIASDGIPHIPKLGNVAIGNRVFVALEEYPTRVWQRAIIFECKEARDYFLKQYKSDMKSYKDGMLVGGHIYHVITYTNNKIEYIDMDRSYNTEEEKTIHNTNEL